MRVTGVHVAVDGNWTISTDAPPGVRRPDRNRLGAPAPLRQPAVRHRPPATRRCPTATATARRRPRARPGLAALQASLHAPSAYNSPPASSPINGSPIPSAPQLSGPSTNAANIVNGLSYGTSQSRPTEPADRQSQTGGYPSSYESKCLRVQLPRVELPRVHRAASPTSRRSPTPRLRLPRSPTPTPRRSPASRPTSRRLRSPTRARCPRRRRSPRRPRPSPYLSRVPTPGQQLSPLTTEQPSTPTLSDAVKAAHNEGQEFGESVARDAPALWLEAVLARKPRMPSDLEARLLQGLGAADRLPAPRRGAARTPRRGFWDALERSRR